MSEVGAGLGRTVALAIMRAAVSASVPWPCRHGRLLRYRTQGRETGAASRAAEAGAVPVLVSPVSGRAWRWPGAAGCPACSGGSVLSVLRWLVGPQVSTGAGLCGGRGSRALAGAGVPLAVNGVAAWPGPGRQLQAGAPLLQ